MNKDCSFQFSQFSLIRYSTLIAWDYEPLTATSAFSVLVSVLCNQIPLIISGIVTHFSEVISKRRDFRWNSLHMFKEARLALRRWSSDLRSSSILVWYWIPLLWCLCRIISLGKFFVMKSDSMYCILPIWLFWSLHCKSKVQGSLWYS